MTRLETVGRPISELWGKESSLNSSASAELAEVAMRYSGTLLLFYPLNNFEAVVKQVDTAGWNAATLIDADGMVFATSCMKQHWQEGDNIYDKLNNSDVARRITGHWL